MPTEHRCKDCRAEGRQGPELRANYPGPRCHNHNRLFVKAQKAARHEKYVEKTYGLSEGQYAALYASQGGRCAICAIATGATKRLAVDHDHVSGYVRGLLCGPCNQQIGIWTPHILSNAIAYLAHPPAFHAIGRVKP